ncbi:MAG: hypothetical protein NZ651_05170 [Candidatus Bipolaricaulota bacterium]|nr:hypothetical protein [Candidatus Bipolaricaulota bacterium]MDW8127143.1 hypothetical protein [Candidatus Bipolaricaulota bacterium]
MQPFQLFLLLALLGAVAVMGYLTVTDCAQSELVTLKGTVVGKTVGTVEREQTVVVGGCPACPGSKTETRVVRVSEEVYYLIVEVEENGEIKSQRFLVSEEVYRRTQPGTPVEVRYLRGKTRGIICTEPELIFASS